jgi:D-alanyl-D-alanine carboxypeptidase
MRIGSVSKSFTTTVILQLVDEGLISLDDTLDNFNTGIPNADQITVRQICNHTSGLYNYTSDSSLIHQLLTNPLGFVSPQQLVQIAIDHGPIFAPGTQVQYNNTGFILQGIIIEQVTGNPLEREIQARILTPLQFTSTSLPLNSFLTGEFSRGYLFSDGERFDFTTLNPSYSWAAGGLISNLIELKTWAKVLATGTLLTPATQQQRLTLVTPSPIPGPFQGPFVKYGLGLEALGPFLGHDGDIIGYNATTNYLPSQDATFVILVNRKPNQSFPSDDASLILMALSKILFPSEVPW